MIALSQGSIRIAPLHASPTITMALSDILIEVVATALGQFHAPFRLRRLSACLHASSCLGRRGYASFLAPSTAKHWSGTVTLLLDLPPQSPHRAEIAR